MTTHSPPASEHPEPKALLLLAEYLDLPLRDGGSLVMMQQCNDLCGMYVGKASGGQEGLTFYGTISASIANSIRRLTRIGRNQVEIAGRQYHFVRSTTHFEDRGAELFALL
ncbi:hypothetical protein AWB76_05851 [Caballeronia temeraria]|uniref:Uncharacterized protein n=1 Tax=Caballeronia temeraria TaxID=1777137 RepID=A0A158CQE2_9BURK|nr:hypothetical protein [Caballeronia temeraria]SAK84538.1 hypothetical protein AWB76_05851 [Caballeronia temeraria]